MAPPSSHRERTVEEVAASVRRAARRLEPHLPPTPLLRSSRLSEAAGGEVFLKLESLQPTGSFKVRGALHRLLQVPWAERAAGVVAASTGNHGAAVAWAARRLGMPAVLFVPDTASAGKVEAIQRAGVQVRRVSGDPLEAELAARAHAAAEGAPYVSPYNDYDVIAGQGTVAVELLRQAPELDRVYLSLGGGGLAAGVAALLRVERPEAAVVGCSPERSAVMIESIEAGRILELPSRPTLSDGTAGGVEAGAVTFPLCRDLLAERVRVPEARIRRELLETIRQERLWIEGAAAVAAAACRDAGRRLAGQRVAVVLCGGNLDWEAVEALLRDRQQGGRAEGTEPSRRPNQEA